MKKKVIIALQSQFSGHLSRGLVYYDILKENYNVEVVTIGCQPESWFAEELNTNIISMPGLSMIETNKGGISQLGTAWTYIKNYPSHNRSRANIYTLLDNIKPDFVLSDFESEISSICKKEKIPVICIDAHRRLIMPECPRPKIRLQDYWDFFCMKVGLFYVLREGDLNIAISFAPFELKLETRCELPVYKICPPLLRKEILQAIPSDGDYLLIYHNNGGEKEKIIKELRNFRTIVYGYNCRESYGKVQFKEFSGQQFIRDLAGCKNYASRAGFESIAEALYYKKPCYLVAQKGQFEQTFNAYHASLHGAQTEKEFNYQAAWSNNKRTRIDSDWLKSGRNFLRKTIDSFASEI
jgi:uncharacterized protein (TIGR00661 family)